jgi:hypothetical protein
MTQAISANSVIIAQNEVSGPIALYLGAALIVTTCLSTLYLPDEGILPTLFIIGLFQTFCIVMPDRLATSSGRRALVIAGSLISITCHLLLTWLF